VGGIRLNLQGQKHAAPSQTYYYLSKTNNPIHSVFVTVRSGIAGRVFVEASNAKVDD
jgi:hypothetical protein